MRPCERVSSWLRWVVACRHALDSWQSLLAVLAAAHPSACSALYTMTSRYSKPDALAILCNAHGEVFRANACGFCDDTLHFLCSSNIWLASSWCMCWLHLLPVSCFRLSPFLSRGCQCCETAAVREFSLSLSHSHSPSSSLARCLSQFLSLPLSFPLFLLFCLSLSLGWVIGWECVCERDRLRVSVRMCLLKENAR